MVSPLITLRAVDSANFRTSRRADETNDRLMGKLGLKFRYEPARLALARSLVRSSSMILLNLSRESIRRNMGKPYLEGTSSATKNYHFGSR